jgi:hypothetical protein
MYLALSEQNPSLTGLFIHNMSITANATIAATGAFGSSQLYQYHTGSDGRSELILIGPGTVHANLGSSNTISSRISIVSNNSSNLSLSSSNGGSNVLIIGSQTANLTIQSFGSGSSASLKIFNTSGPSYANIGSTTSVGSQVNIISSLPSTSNSIGALVVSGGVGVSGNIYVGGTTAGQTGVYTDNLRYAANGLPWSTNSSSANTLTTPSFSISESGGKLIFKYGSTVIASMGANGIFISANNVIAGGTP